MKKELENPTHFCPVCGKEPKYDSDEFCCVECEWLYQDKAPPVTRRSAAIIKIAPNGDISYD